MRISTLILLITTLPYSLGISNKISSSSLSQAIETIDSMVQSLFEEQKVHDLTFENQLKQCKSEIKYRETELSDAKYAYSRAVVEHDVCESGKHHREAKISTVKNGKSFIESFDSQLKSMQGLERGYSAKKLSQYEYLSFLTEQILFSNDKPVFLQIVNKALSTTNSELVGEMTGFLEQSTTEVFEQRMKSLKTAVEEAHEERASAINEIDYHYKRIFELTSQLVNSYEDSEEQQKDHILALEECIKKQENMKFIASDLELRSQNLLRNIGILCKDWADQYKQLSSERSTQQDLLLSLKQITSKRFG
ncbi:hypothetical protein SteCoe_32639 [Stentor coeruleus]|uniref:Uncharacterized protein n=1 Tax=Stentor coeruleus TaxID=5963 RepID=A0A1R2AYH7_9CILI|nr:hypothetical protein SteCoe_32639 [Stentor coeruleus]